MLGSIIAMPAPRLARAGRKPARPPRGLSKPSLARMNVDGFEEVAALRARESYARKARSSCQRSIRRSMACRARAFAALSCKGQEPGI